MRRNLLLPNPLCIRSHLRINLVLHSSVTRAPSLARRERPWRSATPSRTLMGLSRGPSPTPDAWNARKGKGFPMMRRLLFAGLAGASLIMTLGRTPAGAAGLDDGHGRRYPEAPRSDTVDDYHGTKVADPY